MVEAHHSTRWWCDAERGRRGGARAAGRLPSRRVEARAVPGMFELLEGGVSVSRLRQIDIADLLRRQPIQAAPEAGLYLQGRTVLVTGAGGSIGSELCRQLARAQVGELVLLGHGENSIFDITNRLRQSNPGVPVHPVIADVRDEARIEAVFAAYAPSIVFHAAAHKHVPLMERTRRGDHQQCLGTAGSWRSGRRRRTVRVISTTRRSRRPA